MKKSFSLVAVILLVLIFSAQATAQGTEKEIIKAGLAEQVASLCMDNGALAIQVQVLLEEKSGHLFHSFRDFGFDDDGRIPGGGFYLSLYVLASVGQSQEEYLDWSRRLTSERKMLESILDYLRGQPGKIFTDSRAVKIK